MPIYEYRCAACGFQKEYLQKMGDALLTVCSECGAASLRKMVTAAGFQLKGSGWYATDFKDQQAKKGNGAAKSESAEGKDGAVAASPGEKDSKEAAAGKSAAASTDSKSEAATDKSAAASTDSKPVAAAKSGAE